MNYKEDSKISAWKIWPKVIAIEESEDLETICVEELMGFL
jgi:hypothetical protein